MDITSWLFDVQHGVIGTLDSIWYVIERRKKKRVGKGRKNPLRNNTRRPPLVSHH
jgi:hypothetical protein